LLTRLESLNDRLELLAQVDQVKFRIVNGCAALLAIPAHVVVRFLSPFVLDNQTDRIRGPLRRMGNPGWEQKNIALPDRNLARLAVFHDSEHDVAFELVEELFTRVDMIIGALIWAADDHDHEVAVPDQRIPDWRLQQLPVL